MVRGSLNLPAHTFYPSRRTIARTLISRHRDIITAAHSTTTAMTSSARSSGLRVVLFCGSSQGRGPRCAGWLRDALKEEEEEAQQAGASKTCAADTLRVMIMEGGIKRFVAKYGGDSELLVQLPDEVKES